MSHTQQYCRALEPYNPTFYISGFIWCELKRVPSGLANLYLDVDLFLTQSPRPLIVVPIYHNSCATMHRSSYKSWLPTNIIRATPVETIYRASTKITADT
jgi:hypothetical protein